MAFPFAPPKPRPRVSVPLTNLPPGVQDRMRSLLASRIAQQNVVRAGGVPSRNVGPWRPPVREEARAPAVSVKGGVKKTLEARTVRDLVRQAHEGQVFVPGGAKRAEVRKNNMKEAQGRWGSLALSIGSRELARRVLPQKPRNPSKRL